MATKSIYKDVRVKDKHFGRSLANALENSKAGKSPKVIFQRTPQRIEKDKINDFFRKDSK
ncbi:MAG: hypothetical protein ACI4KA_02890 [Oscillospiraceae bacterium]